MSFAHINSSFLQELGQVLDPQYIFLDEQTLRNYAKDYTEDLSYLPEVAVKPRTPEEISSILRLCNKYNIAATPRGAGTGLSGGALPVWGGVVISMERFSSILHVDERNFQATVEPGVINQVFQEHVSSVGLFYPPDPASKGSCFLGGNIAHNSGGPRALKYGVTKDYVLNLEVVLPTGEIMWTGANTLKNSTGYSLTQLMLGSEGTLGIVTKIVFKLIPLPRHNMLMLASFASAEKACEAVAQIFRSGSMPSALEFMERSAVEITVQQLGRRFHLPRA